MPRRQRHEVWFAVVVPAALIGVLVVFLPPALSQGNQKQVRICHATSAHDNPYVSESPAIENNGAPHGGHLNHPGPVFPAPDGGDIIPPYMYVDENGDTQVFPGYNWGPDGQAIWQNDCAPGLDPLNPLVECVEARPGGAFLAHFGYDNPNDDSISVPFENVFDPLTADGNQPTTFQPGRVQDAFQVQSGGGPLTWRLTGNLATATAGSPRCQGSITIFKVLNPSTDPGRFNLEIDGQTVGGGAGVGDGGTSGTIAVATGRHTVGESGAAGASLDDHDPQIRYVSGTAPVAEGSGPTLAVTVENRQALLCGITNTLKVANTISAVLECVVFRGGVPEQAVWGYSNPNSFPVTIPVGAGNAFAPAPTN